MTGFLTFLLCLVGLWVAFRLVTRVVLPLFGAGGRQPALFGTSGMPGAARRLPTLPGAGTANVTLTGGSRTFLLLCAIVILCLVLSYLAYNFASPQNLLNIARNVAFAGIVAIGMTAVMMTGGIDLSVGSTAMFAATVTGLAMGAGLPVTLAIPAALGASLLIGLANGWAIVTWSAPPFLVTLVTLYLTRSLGLILTGAVAIRDFGPDGDILMELGGGSAALFGLRIPNVLFVLLGLGVAAALLFRRTSWGRQLVEIGTDERLAKLADVRVNAVRISAYMFVAFTAGLCGVLYAGLFRGVTLNVGTGMELTAIAAAMLGGASLAGGRGTVLGALAGATLIELSRNGLIILGVDTFWQGLVAGLFVLLALALNSPPKGETK